MAEPDKRAERAGASGPKVIFACSGAADVGEIADLAARRLASQGAGKMFCLAGIAGGVSGMIATAEAASAILAIDGCPLDCTRKTLEQAGFTEVEHLQLSELGMERGESAPTEERICQVVDRGKTCLAG